MARGGRTSAKPRALDAHDSRGAQSARARGHTAGPAAQALTEAITCHGDGDLRGAVHAARHAYVEATCAEDHSVSLAALLRLAAYSYELGQLGRAEELARRATGDGPDAVAGLDAGDGAVRASCHAILGLIAGHRGHWHEASDCFDRAQAAHTGDTRASWTVQLGRAMVLSEYAPQRAVETVAALPGDAAARLQWRARMVEGRARVTLGDTDQALAVLGENLVWSRTPLESAFVRLYLGEAHLAAGDADAAACVLAEALPPLEAEQAGFWLARAHLVLADASDDGQAERHRATAATLDDGDLAFRRLFEARREVRIHLGAEPGLWLGPRRATFMGRQAEYTLYALALAGAEGVSICDLAERLWPAPEAERLPARVRTLLWQVRRALGPEAWRLERDGDQLGLDLRGISVTGVDDAQGQVLGEWDFLGPEALTWLAELAVRHPAA